MKRNLLFKNLGVSLIEIMAAVAIIGITLLAWRFTSKDHVRIAAVTEGRNLIEKVVAQEKMYMANKGSFKAIGTASTFAKNDNDVMVNTYDNKYFLDFIVTNVTTAGFNVTAKGSGKANNISVVGAYTASSNDLAITEKWN